MCQNPEGLGETRNTSCTPVFSKVMEFFLLARLKNEATVKCNQFGGLAGSSTNHYLAEAWTDIMEALDQDGGVANVLSIDFAKAFNTIQHQACLRALESKGATNHTMRMAAAFLSDRKMVFRAGRAVSTSRQLKSGAPQGTLMGNYLFILTTDRLEEDKTNREISATRQAIQRLRLEREWYRTNDPTDESRTPLKRKGIIPLMNDQSFSTPTTRGQFVNFCPSSDEDNDSEKSFIYFARRKQLIFRLEDSNASRSELLAADEMNLHCPRPENWKDPPLNMYKFVDDFLSCEKSWIGDGSKSYSQTKSRSLVHAQKCERFFNIVKTNAKEIGMLVNDKKTK